MKTMNSTLSTTNNTSSFTKSSPGVNNKTYSPDRTVFKADNYIDNLLAQFDISYKNVSDSEFFKPKQEDIKKICEEIKNAIGDVKCDYGDIIKKISKWARDCNDTKYTALIIKVARYYLFQKIASLNEKTSLKSIDVNRTRIGDILFQKIASLNEKKLLKSIDVNGNSIIEELIKVAHDGEKDNNLRKLCRILVEHPYPSGTPLKSAAKLKMNQFELYDNMYFLKDDGTTIDRSFHNPKMPVCRDISHHKLENSKQETNTLLTLSTTDKIDNVKKVHNLKENSTCDTIDIKSGVTNFYAAIKYDILHNNTLYGEFIYAQMQQMKLHSINGIKSSIITGNHMLNYEIRYNSANKLYDLILDEPNNPPYYHLRFIDFDDNTSDDNKGKIKTIQDSITTHSSIIKQNPNESANVLLKFMQGDKNGVEKLCNEAYSYTYIDNNIMKTSPFKGINEVLNCEDKMASLIILGELPTELVGDAILQNNKIDYSEHCKTLKDRINEFDANTLIKILILINDQDMYKGADAGHHFAFALSYVTQKNVFRDNHTALKRFVNIFNFAAQNNIFVGNNEALAYLAEAFFFLTVSNTDILKGDSEELKNLTHTLHKAVKNNIFKENKALCNLAAALCNVAGNSNFKGNNEAQKELSLAFGHAASSNIFKDIKSAQWNLALALEIAAEDNIFKDNDKALYNLANTLRFAAQNNIFMGNNEALRYFSEALKFAAQNNIFKDNHEALEVFNLVLEEANKPH